LTPEEIDGIRKAEESKLDEKLSSVNTQKDDLDLQA
jgi:hypothetical protein